MFRLVFDFYIYVALAAGAVATVIFWLLHTLLSNSHPRDNEKVQKMYAFVFIGFFLAALALLIWLEPPPRWRG